MGIKNYLDSTIEKYYKRTLKFNGFELIETNIGGMAGIYYFKSEWLNFSILNDRGIIETKISSIHSKKEFDFDIINALLNYKNRNKIEKPKFGKNDLSKRLNLSQESSLFESNIELLKEMFNKRNYRKTESELHKFQKERAKLIFE